jgi:hypothetical protein
MNDEERAAFRIARDKAMADRQQLDGLIAYLSERLGEPLPVAPGTGVTGPEQPVGQGGSPGADPVAGTNEGEYFDFVSTKAALELLTKFGSREHPLTTTQILDAIRKGGVKIGSEEALYRSLARSHRFRKVGKGVWGLSEWYPARSPRRATTEAAGMSGSPPRGDAGIDAIPGDGDADDELTSTDSLGVPQPDDSLPAAPPLQADVA